jgi:hypothetical protein
MATSTEYQELIERNLLGNVIQQIHTKSVKLNNVHQCRVHTYATTGSGYGQVRVSSLPSRPKLYAHVVACMGLHGPIPPNMEASHICGNKSCITHLVFESGEYNKSRFACFYFLRMALPPTHFKCVHEPQCLI